MVGKLGYHLVPDPFVMARYWQCVVSGINKKRTVVEKKLRFRGSRIRGVICCADSGAKWKS
jgi:hypothetical protein